MDASIRLQSSDLGSMITRARKHGVVARRKSTTVLRHTLKFTFDFLSESPCLFRDAQIFESGFVLVRSNGFISEYFLKPWVGCALVRGCMVTVGDVMESRRCPQKPQPFSCHRFDQSVLSILIHRLYHRNEHDHALRQEENAIAYVYRPNFKAIKGRSNYN